MPSISITFLIVLSCIRWIDIKGLGWMRAGKVGVRGAGSRISYEFSTQGRGFEK
jgi:hypothetical protein